MESNKLDKKILDWATGLGFRLPDGSSPPEDYFALLTATPHRRQLWEAIVESVQPRQKIEHMRKQILVAKLQGTMKVSDRNYQHQITDRIGLWEKQNSLETNIKEKRNAVHKLEENIMAKASDLVFETCKLAEIEKQHEELNDKLLILKLLSKREKKLMDELGNSLLNFSSTPNSKGGSENIKENVGFVLDQLLNAEICKCQSVDCHYCSGLNKIEQMLKSGIPEQCIWEEVIKHKKNFLQQFSEFIVKLKSTEKDILREKAGEIPKILNHSVTQIKQKIMTKSLQVMMNSNKGKFLDLKIEGLEERLMRSVPHDEDSNEGNSFFSYRNNESFEENERSFKNLKRHLDVMGLKNYREFLKNELNKLEEKELMSGRKDSSKEEEQVQVIINDFDSVMDEINSYKSEEKKIGKEILGRHNELESLQRRMKEETEKMNVTMTTEKTTEKLKTASEKQIDLFSEIPLDAFKTFESSSGRIQFECESESHCLENYGGELKQFFSAILIPPMGDMQKIISEIKNRQNFLNKVKKFISDRDNLASVERKIQSHVSSIKYDLQLCEKNFKESDGILWNTLSRTEHLVKEIDFVEKILKNWIEQPYRLMVPEPLEGKSLKEIEDQYRKGRID